MAKRIYPAGLPIHFYKLSISLRVLLEDSLRFAPRAFDDVWLSHFKRQLKVFVDVAVQKFEAFGDKALIEQPRSAQKFGYEFLALIVEKAAYGKHWNQSETVPQHKKLHDDLFEWQRTFEIVALTYSAGAVCDWLPKRSRTVINEAEERDSVAIGSDTPPHWGPVSLGSV